MAIPENRMALTQSAVSVILVLIAILIFDITVGTKCLFSVVFALATVCLYQYWKRRQSENRRRLPPFPVNPWPVVGNFPNLSENPRKQFKAWHKQCGDLFSLYFGSRLVIVVSGYDTIKEVLVHKGSAVLDRPVMFANDVIGLGDAGLAFSCGSVWREHRTVTFHIFKELGLGSNVLVNRINKEVECYIDELITFDGQSMNIRPLTYAAISNIICSMVLGKRFGYRNEKFEQALKDIENVAKYAKEAGVVNFVPILSYLPGDMFKQRPLQDAVGGVRDFFAEYLCSESGIPKEKFNGVKMEENQYEKDSPCTECVYKLSEYAQKNVTCVNIGNTPPEETKYLNEEHNQEKELQNQTDVSSRQDANSVNEAECTKRMTFASLYRDKCQHKRETNILTTLDERNLLKTALDLFGAGTETTASTIVWCLLYTLRAPDVQANIHKELDSVIGRSRRPVLTDRANLPYLDAVIMETQRLASVLPFSLMRVATKDVPVGDYVIPTGSYVLVNLDTALHDPEIWGADADQFRPDRFLDASGNVIHRDEMIPFSLGRRSCLGKSIAKMELFLFISSLFQRFQFVPDNSESLPALEEIFGLTSVPKPFKLSCIKRY